MRRDIQTAGLLGSAGVVLGQFQNNYLCHDGPEHVLCFAPTPSGKAVGLVIPSLLNRPGLAIVHDIKGENRDRTAGFRSHYGITKTEVLTECRLVEVRRLLLASVAYRWSYRNNANFIRAFSRRFGVAPS